MKTAVFLSWLFWGSLSAGCSHEKHDEREWTKEELAELEAKWGFDVRNHSTAFVKQDGTLNLELFSGHLLGLVRLRTWIMSSA